MSSRTQGRARQVRKERPFKERARDTSVESTRSTGSVRNESRGNDFGRSRKNRDSRAEEAPSRARDKNHESSGKASSADSKERGKPESGRRGEKASYREKNNALVQGRDGYRDLPKDRRPGSFTDDSPLSVMVRQISREADCEKRLATAKKLEEFINQPANCQAVLKVVDEILAFAESTFRERNSNTFELKEQIAKCVGMMGSHLGADAKAFIFLVISKVETASSDELKSLFVKILIKIIEQDRKKHRHREFIPMLLARLHNILENADTSDLLHSVLSIIMPIAVEYPQDFTPHFRDMVDILIGWHIDTSQHDNLIQFTSDCLISLHHYWVADINFSLTLLTQFLEDMEAYSDELKCIADGQLTGNDVSPPYSSLPKLAALVRVFTTVMNGIGDCFTPVRTPTITQEYIRKLIKGVIDCVRSGGYSFFYEDLFVKANECFGIMCCFLQKQFSVCCDITATFALEQLAKKSLTFAHTKSVLSFIKQVIKHVNTSIPGSFIDFVLKHDSSIMKLRLCADEEVLRRLLEIFQGLLNIKSAPLMQATYRILVEDLKEAYTELKCGRGGGDDLPTTPDLAKAESSRPDELLTTEDKETEKNGENEDETLSSDVKLYQAQVRTVFDLRALGGLNISQSSLATLAWKLSPSLAELLTEDVRATEWNVADRFPSVQYAIMSSLYDYCKRNNYFLENTPGVVSASDENNNILGKVQEIILEVLQYLLASSDIRRFCLAWIVDLVELDSDSETTTTRMNFDSLVETMLPLSFLAEESVRLSVSLCIRLMIQRKMLSNDTMKRSFQECLFHVTDVNSSVKSAFVQLLTCVPVDLGTSFKLERSSVASSKLGPGRGNTFCEKPLTLSINGSWLSRKIHMMRPSTGTFHSHNFRLVSAFILQGVLPADDVNQDWLLHLYHTCQRASQAKKQSHPVNDKYYFSSRHDPNSVVPISSNHSLLWFWATWELAQFCVLSRLKTPLGRAQETFQAIESVLREYLGQLCPDSDSKPIRIKKKSAPEEVKKPTTEHPAAPPSVCQLRVKMLLQFVENLDKLMYSAYEGAAVSLPAFPKAVRLFFRTNKSTCQEWLSRIRGMVTSVSTGCGDPTTAVRQGLQLLREMKNSEKAKDRDFEMTVLVISKALGQLKASEALQGLSTWCKKHNNKDFPWLQAMVHKCKGRYEKAICEYERCLEAYQNSHSDEGQTSESGVYPPNSAIFQFLINEVTDCYTKLTDWPEVEQWQKTVQEIRTRLQNPDLQHAASIQTDMNYIRALHKFEDKDFVGARDCLEVIPGASLQFIIDRISGSPLSVEKEETKSSGYTFSPSWSPQRMLEASDVSMMQAVTLYWTSGMAGGGTKKDEALRNEMHGLLNQATELLEGVIANAAMDWPPSVPEIHSVQYYGVNLLTKILSGKHEEDASHLMPFSSDLTSRCSQPLLDSSVMCKILQISSYNHYHHNLHGKYQERTQEQLSTLQLATIRSARKEQNFRLAYKLLMNHLGVSEDKTSKVVLPRGDSGVYSETLCKSLYKALRESENPRIKGTTRYLVYRESAKLLHSLGDATDAASVLCDGILPCTNVNDKGANTTDFNARLLCTLAKWIMSDKKIFSGNSKGDVNQLKANLTRIMSSRDLGSACSEDVKLPSDDVDAVCGRLLDLGCQYAPHLEKAWFALGGWAYRMGRKAVEQASSGGSVDISKEERDRITSILPQDISSDQRQEVMSVLSKGHFTTVGAQDEEINSGNEVLTREDETVKKQLTSVRPSLSESCVESLVVIWRGICERLFSHYRTAVNAYFKYLKLRGETTEKCDSDSDSNVTATLRLLRLLVKHAGELQTGLENGFLSTPTGPWEGIIPQLFSRLNHPEEYVRKGVTDLLCRVSKDSPHLILYAAVVGCSGNQLRREHNTSSLMTLVASRSDDADNTFCLDEEDVNLELGEDQNLQTGYHTIVDSLADGNPRLVSEVQEFVQELRRVTLLWEELWLGSLIQIHHDFEKRQSQLNDEIKRVNSSSSLTTQEKATLIRNKHVALMKPIAFALEQLQTITTKQPETPHEEWFQKTYSSVIENALHALKNPEEPSKPQTSWSKFRQLLQLLQQRSQKRSSVNLRLEEISPKLCKLNPSFIYMPGQEFSMSKVVTVNSLENDIVILPTKTRPKKIILVGSDGQKYTYLFKGLEDLHLDERIMQFLSICNNMFAKPNRYEENVFLARHYSVTPLGPRSGLIQWVDGAVPIFSLYKRWQQRDAASTVALTKNEPGGYTSTVRPSLRPSDLFYNKLTPLLTEKGIDVSSSNRREWPLPIMRKVLQELLQETPQDLLEKELWCSSTCTSDWWKMSQSYSRSIAVMSMIGYILGLGDRHLDNMLIDFTTGEVVHIDYNICFEKGKGLRVPEKVPFRLTANLETALGVTGVEGTFRSSCEKVLRVLRGGRETLLTLLEAFVYDPLVDWTTGNDNAFANAFYGGRALDPQDLKQSKKDMERTITQCLFSSRVAEMRVSWRANRDDMVQSLNKLKEAVDTYFSTVGQSLAVDENDKELLDQMDILQSAVKSSSHPLHAVQAKYDEQSRMRGELENVRMSIQERLKECQQWDVQHQAALDTVRSTKLANIASELLKPLDVGLPSFAPAIGFLQNAGQASTVSQCEQVETELTGLLHKRRSLLRACLDVLHTYATVISQFPAGYSHNSRSYDWQCWLRKLIDNSSTDECQAILRDYDVKHSGPMHVTDETAALIKIETKLQNIFNEQKTKFAKFYERRNQENVETSFLNNAATESLQNLKQFVHDKGEEGKLATVHVMVTALSSLHKRCLVMEDTARGSRLLDLVSRDGDWFLEELCSMTGNVIQFASFARTYWMDSSSVQDSRTDDAVVSVQALTSIYTMYKSLQDMMSNFRNIIVPETLKCLEMKDSSVKTVITRFKEITLSASLSVDDMIQTLQSCAFKKNEKSKEVMKISVMAADLEKEMVQLLNTGDSEMLNGNGDEHKLQMTAGQMLLAGFNGLFTKLETEMEVLLGAVSEVDPTLSDATPVFKEVKDLQIYQNGNHNVLKSLYLLKRLNVMKLFFSDSLHHVDNLAGDPGERQADHVIGEDQLSVHVRRFIADFVQERILGLPSFVLTKTILQWLSLIGLDVSENLNDENVTLEDLCKKAVDRSIKQGMFTGAILSQANSLTGSFNTSWKKHDLARRLDLNVSLYRCVVQRAQLTLARFQWYHEDLLAVAPVRGNTLITPTRSTVMSDLRKRVQNLLSLDVAMSGVQERFTHLESSIEQRLKWAAGANPSLNLILENFEHTLKERKRLILVEGKYSSEICAISNAILHFEAFRTRTPEAITADQALAALVQRCQESSAKVEKSQETLKDVEELMAKIQVSSPPAEPITFEWIKNRLSSVKEDLVTNQTQKTQVEKCILNSKEHLRSQVATVKAAWTAHQVLMGEVKSMLQSLAKDEDAAESSDARAFIITHNKLNEVTTKLLKDILSLCGSGAAGKSTGEGDQAKTTDLQAELLASIHYVYTIATWVFDHLTSLATPLINNDSEVKDTTSDGTTQTFASALRQGPQLIPPVAKETVQLDSGMSGPALAPPVKETLSPTNVLSPQRQATTGSTTNASSRKPSMTTLRDPRTGKAIQERNTYAIGVWKRVKAKLDGREVDSTKRMSVEDQVDHIIGEATSLDNLCLMYEGWTPWV